MPLRWPSFMCPGVDTTPHNRCELNRTHGNVPTTHLLGPQMCPHKHAFVLDHGMVGDDANGNLYVSCPLHKKNFSLDNGDCFNDVEYKILAFDVKQEGEDLLIHLPEADELGAILSTAKWMVKAATAEALERNDTTQLEIVGPDGESAGSELNVGECASAAGGCGSTELDW